jgi:hypothetical protein
VRKETGEEEYTKPVKNPIFGGGERELWEYNH